MGNTKSSSRKGTGNDMMTHQEQMQMNYMKAQQDQMNAFYQQMRHQNSNEPTFLLPPQMSINQSPMFLRPSHFPQHNRFDSVSPRKSLNNKNENAANMQKAKDISYDSDNENEETSNYPVN